MEEDKCERVGGLEAKGEIGPYCRWCRREEDSTIASSGPDLGQVQRHSASRMATIAQVGRGVDAADLDNLGQRCVEAGKGHGLSRKQKNAVAVTFKPAVDILCSVVQSL